MTPEITPNLATAIERCLVNGERLLDDAKLLHDFERYSTAFALAVLAQEELAKVFLLRLVEDGALRWNDPLRKALRNHECKHLVSIVMEWLHRSGEEQFERVRSRVPDPPFEGVPDDVAFAVNILRHEKFERFERGFADREREWDGLARKIAEGKREREKQAALYVSVGESGFPEGLPSQVTATLSSEEIERGARLRELVSGSYFAYHQYEYLKEALSLIFADRVVVESSGEPTSD